MNCTLYLRDREKGKSVPRTTWHQGVESDQNSTLFFCLLKCVPWQVVSIFSANSTVRQEIGLLRDPQFLLDYITTQKMLEVLLLFVCFSDKFKHPETHQQVQIRTRAHFKTNQQLRWEKYVLHSLVQVPTLNQSLTERKASFLYKDSNSH